MFTRVASGRAEVVRELRAAGPLLAALRAPATARAPWLTTALNVRAAVTPVAVVVERDRQGPPEALAALALHRRGGTVTATLLGDGLGPVPPGAPAARLPARDDAAAQRLAAGILALLDGHRRPWTLRLTGLPLGDPTLGALGRLRPDAAFANARSSRLVDSLDEAGAVRSSDPHDLERRLPELLARLPDLPSRTFLRAAARLHAAIGQLELAVVADGERVDAALLTLVDGADRRPWWGFSEVGGLAAEMAAPVVTFRARRGPDLSRRSGRR
ncbi:hypothetical protein [Geodermatophilus ruber]|uniref:BioF2-like acetyltransferase domain-containing protein n=1 Tax=Geodermatophilus ruber TaxID=504800 RepID=A0A1I4LVC2_9ACTN|nr:hypothetical protein [Geodermatophilus ruber]SFL94940.1 hypothetical protein SAMN04488085_1255 [Geodermatophilus ruber]